MSDNKIKEIFKNNSGLTCKISNYQMFEVCFWDDSKEKEPKIVYKSCNLYNAIKGAINIYNRRIKMHFLKKLLLSKEIIENKINRLSILKKDEQLQKELEKTIELKNKLISYMEKYAEEIIDNTLERDEY